MEDGGKALTSRVVLAGGWLADGTGSPLVNADIALEGGVISEIGTDISQSGAEVYDCGDLIVAPGFIDIHTHSDLTRIAYPDAETRTYQGVTTEVIGNCGLSPSPVAPDRQGFRSIIGPIDVVPDLDFTWTSMAEYLDVVDSTPGATNLVPLIGHGSLRYFVKGVSQSPATQAELQQIIGLLRDALELGFWGMSFGFMYAPGESSDKGEIDALARELAHYGALMSVHMRGYDTGSLIAAVQEVLGVAETTGVATQISHLRSIFDDGSALERALDLIMASSADVEADAYPYIAGHTTMLQLFPPEIRSQGVPAITGFLRDTAEAGAAALRGAAGFNSDNIFIAKAGESLEFSGKTLAEVAKMLGESDVAVAAVKLLITHDANVDIIIIGSRPEDAARVLKERFVSIASDGVSLSLDHAANLPHPRSIGTFPRAFRELSDGGMPIEDIIFKMTQKPAKRVGLQDRGRLAPGLVADVVAFDAAEIADRATYADPLVTPTGVNHVVVGGEFVFRNGEPTGSRPGRLLRRAQA